MQIILYDTEFTAWEGSVQHNWRRPNEHKEIIQLSAVKLQINRSEIEILEQSHNFIQPSINKTLSGYIKNLTGIEQSQVDKGLTNQQLFDELFLFSNNGSIPFYSWGNDWHVLNETAQINQLDISWVKSYDLCPLFKSTGVPDHFSSGTLYQFFGLPLNLHEHNAVDDTISLTESLKHLHKKSSEQVHSFFKPQPA